MKIDKHEAERLVTNVEEIIASAKALRIELTAGFEWGTVDVKEDGWAWNHVGIIAGSLANVHGGLWPDEDSGPLS